MESVHATLVVFVFFYLWNSSYIDETFALEAKEAAGGSRCGIKSLGSILGVMHCSTTLGSSVANFRESLSPPPSPLRLMDLSEVPPAASVLTSHRCISSLASPSNTRSLDPYGPSSMINLGSDPIVSPRPVRIDNGIMYSASLPPISGSSWSQPGPATVPSQCFMMQLQYKANPNGGNVRHYSGTPSNPMSLTGLLSEQMPMSSRNGGGGFQTADVGASGQSKYSYGSFSGATNGWNYEVAERGVNIIP